MTSAQTVWSNGKLVAPEQTRVSLLSHGFSRASAIFDVFPTTVGPDGVYGFRMEAHLERFMTSARLLEMELPYDAQQIAQACAETVQANQQREGLVKIFGYWGGEQAIALVPNEPLDLAIYAIPVSPELSLHGDEPISACISKWQKLDKATVPTAAKACANYLNGYLARRDGINRGYDLGIMLDGEGNLAEGSIEAVFVVKDGVLRVPPLDHVLKSVSRESVIELAQYAGIPVDISAISPEQLLDGDELFVAHSLSRVMPIRKIEQRELTSPGPITQQLQQLVRQLFDFKLEPFQGWFQRLY